MANEMFTTRSGQQVPVPELKVPSDVVTTLMRMREDYLIKGQKYSLGAILLELISIGKDTKDRRVKQAAKNKDLRETGKSVKEYIRIQLALRKPIDPSVIAELSGYQVPDEQPQIIEESDEETVELTDEQLEQATAPSGVA